eukprot:TRINITY_DN4314_c0_g1_i3.p1 TRINITY_DN4314_c0_g1~~TRINITY_DN4314_c0_g1_i3.p1  ORF type:complete len:579 (+),score=272.54 TRINITY_DN4314_c0_g1_i3:85-1821(+)
MLSRFCMLIFFFFFFKQKTAYEMLRSLVGSEMCIRDSINAEYGILGVPGMEDFAELQRKSAIMQGSTKSDSADLSKDSQHTQKEAAKAQEKPKLDPRQAEMMRLNDQLDVYTRKIEVELRKISEIGSQITEVKQNIKSQQDDILEWAGRSGVSNAAKDSNMQIQKQIRQLENRLEKALIKFNEAIAHNKALREEIDGLRRERVVFDSIYKKLEKELDQKKKEMANIIEISNSAYESRDQAQQEMQALKKQLEEEQAAFEEEWKDLGRIIEADRQRKAVRAAKVEDVTGQRGEMTVEEEVGMKKKLIKGTWAIARDKASMHVQAEKVQTYEEAFARIMDATDIHSIDALVDTFINAEDKNFTLFNFVNELTSEIEKLEEQISDIKAEVDKYRGQDMNSDHQRKKILKDLEEKLGRTETKAEQYDAKFGQSTKILSSLKDGIHAIFTNIGCNMNGVSEVLGTGGVTEGNIMTYLGLIEQRTNEMLSMYNNIAKQHDGGPDQELHRTAQSSMLGPQSAPGTTHIAILPPTTGDEYDEEEEASEDDDETRPLTRDELKAKAQKTMSRKEMKKPNKKPRTAKK